MFYGASLACEPIVEYGSSEPEWIRVDRSLRTLAKARAAHDFDEACSIRDAARTRAYAKLGFASLAEYLNRVFGYGLRLANEKIRVAQALAQLPELALSLRDGVIN